MQGKADGTGRQVQERPVDGGTGGGRGRWPDAFVVSQPVQDRLARLVDGFGGEAWKGSGLAPTGVAVGVGETEQQDLAVTDPAVCGRHGAVHSQGAADQSGTSHIGNVHFESTRSKKAATAVATADGFSTWAAWPAPGTTSIAASDSPDAMRNARRR